MWNHLLNLFFPRTCAGCQSILLSQEIVICTHCRHNIPLTHHHQNPDNELFQRFYGRIPLEFGAALFYFHKKGIVQEMMHQLKYKGHQEIGTVVGEWYASELQHSEPIRKTNCIVPVPLHPKRMRERGYNQVATFGKALSIKLNLPYDDTVLHRKVYTKTQTKKTLLGRSDLDTNLFDSSFSELHHGQHFLLIDDVMTTGATLEACSRALLKIPDAKVSILCMAMAHN
ncbi:ComF family protein [Flavobacterium sedimenticola]|uniref:ComF family protein n=1 Tax=Flavobacterium sedimenticola TaxID=3043286 RepID=A0ABT6XLM3_9FLAO|nr:ComF family protein [Flavobacterium sedimenticola]MDI9255983.1 ComF family protein [Flavobacterium sedimenticola]